jgi:hypothetical protein
MRQVIEEPRNKLTTRLVSEERLERRHAEGVEDYDGSRGRYQAAAGAYHSTR